MLSKRALFIAVISTAILVPFLCHVMGTPSDLTLESMPGTPGQTPTLPLALHRIVTDFNRRLKDLFRMGPGLDEVWRRVRCAANTLCAQGVGFLVVLVGILAAAMAWFASWCYGRRVTRAANQNQPHDQTSSASSNPTSQDNQTSPNDQAPNNSQTETYHQTLPKELISPNNQNQAAKNRTKDDQTQPGGSSGTRTTPDTDETNSEASQAVNYYVKWVFAKVSRLFKRLFTPKGPLLRSQDNGVVDYAAYDGPKPWVAVVFEWLNAVTLRKVACLDLTQPRSLAMSLVVHFFGYWQVVLVPFRAEPAPMFDPTRCHHHHHQQQQQQQPASSSDGKPTTLLAEKGPSSFDCKSSSDDKLTSDDNPSAASDNHSPTSDENPSRSDEKPQSSDNSLPVNRKPLKCILM